MQSFPFPRLAIKPSHRLHTLLMFGRGILLKCLLSSRREYSRGKREITQYAWNFCNKSETPILEPILNKEQNSCILLRLLFITRLISILIYDIEFLLEVSTCPGRCRSWLSCRQTIFEWKFSSEFFRRYILGVFMQKVSQRYLVWGISYWTDH